MKKFLFQSVLLIVIIGVALYFYLAGSSVSSRLPFLSEGPSFKQVQINNVLIKVEVADTQAKRNKGLGGKQSLASDEGMLFIFPQAGRYPFWMKGLNFALDFIWIRGERIVDLTPNVPPQAAGQPDSALPIYQSKEDIDKVLEASAGTIQRLNIKVGDIIKLQ